MPRNKKWTEEENEILLGVLRDAGDQPRNWPEEVREMVKARLVNRTESGIYQQSLKLLKARKVESTDDNTEYQMTFGA